MSLASSTKSRPVVVEEEEIAPARHRVFHKSLALLGLEFIMLFAPVSVVFAGVVILAGEWLPHDSSLYKQMLWSYRATAILIALEMVRRYYNDIFIFGKHRILHISGRLSFRMRKTSISYSDIREVKVRQTVIGRLFRFGDLKFGTASSADYEICFPGIGYPRRLGQYADQVRSEIRAELRALRKRNVVAEEFTLGRSGEEGYCKERFAEMGMCECGPSGESKSAHSRETQHPRIELRIKAKRRL